MRNDQSMSDDLLVKYLLGEASASEDAAVKQWIDSSRTNKDQFDNFRLIWEQSRLLAPASTISTNDAWARFQRRTQQPRIAPKTISMPSSFRWLKAAAIFLLLVGGSWLAWTNMQQTGSTAIAAVSPTGPAPVTPAPLSTAVAVNHMPVAVPAPTIAVAATHTQRTAAIHMLHTSAAPVAMVRKSTRAYSNLYTKESLTRIDPNTFICNGTPYPFEICITQTVKCQNDRPSAVSTCSVIEPDQSGRLHYKSLDKIAKNCNATIDEIRITKINTGEVIVLNDHSTPATAQDFFNHLTGKKKGDVYAGIFHSDCDDDEDCGLTFDSNYGNLIMQ